VQTVNILDYWIFYILFAKTAFVVLCMAWGFFKDRLDSVNDNLPTPVRNDLDKINKEYMANMNINPEENAAINPPELEQDFKPLGTNSNENALIVVGSQPKPVPKSTSSMMERIYDIEPNDDE
jgi:hypothetical protein